MTLDGWIIFILILALFWLIRNERQKEIEQDLFNRTRNSYGRN